MTKKVYVDSEGKQTGEVAKIAALRFVFDDGTFADFDPAKVSDDTLLMSRWHGFSQKIGDSYAGAAKAENPLTFTKESVRDTIAQLYRNEWKAAGADRISDLAHALARVTGDTVEEAHAFVEELSDEEKKQYRGRKKVSAALAEIAAEKAIAKAERLKAKAAEKAANGEDEDEDEDEEEITLTRKTQEGTQPTA